LASCNCPVNTSSLLYETPKHLQVKKKTPSYTKAFFFMVDRTFIVYYYCDTSYISCLNIFHVFPVGLGASVHYSTMRPQELRAYRQHERKKMEKKLNEYVLMCRQLEVFVYVLLFVIVN